jgi:DNA-binding beta-propeller fold protein YncE
MTRRAIEATRRAFALAVFAFGCAFASTAQETEELPPILLRPIAIFSQHLYAGDLNAPRGIFVDSKREEVWVADTGNGIIGVFTPEGVPLFAFGPNDYLREPTMVCLDPGGRVLVLEGQRTAIRIFSYRGEYVGDLKLSGTDEKPVFTAMAFDADGSFYIAENTRAEVLVYDSELRLQRRFGSRGTAEGEFQSIGSIFLTAGEVYIVDHQVLAVQVFDKKGNFLRGWGKHEMGREHFSLPNSVAVDSHGRVIVIDSMRHEIKLFDRSGKFLDRFGGMGRRSGNVTYPTSVAIDAKDHIYVVDRGNSRITVFDEVPPEMAPLPTRPRSNR